MDGELNTKTEIVMSKEEQARLALQNELPEYVVESFMVTGYDTLQVISKMDTSNSPGNSLEEIEQFISTEFIDDPRFARGITSRSVFKFLPGHRRRIIDFVQQIKFNLSLEEKLNRSKKKMKLCAPATKVKKAKYESEESDEVLNQAKAMAMIRQQITKWQRDQSSSKVRELKENVHFEIKVTLSKDSSNLSPSVLCNGCDASILLGIKGKNILLSNWTRHIVKCAEKQKSSAPKENKIQDFFSHKAMPNKPANPSSESISAPETSKELHDKLPYSRPSHESALTPQTSDALHLSSSSSPSETSTQVPEDLQGENKTTSSDNQVFRKAPPAHC